MRIGIINNGLGNVGSVLSAIRFYKYNVSLVEKSRDIKESDVLVLAGVGNFKTAVSKIKEYKLWDLIDEEVTENKKPVLGICLGMQLFANKSYEDGETDGFGWISGEIVKIKDKSVRIPHIGWNEVIGSDRHIFNNLRYNSFYYMHSYHFLPEDREVIIAITKYGDLEIVAAVKSSNIVGVQFHPEKSQADGLRLYRNILEGFK